MAFPHFLRMIRLHSAYALGLSFYFVGARDGGLSPHRLNRRGSFIPHRTNTRISKGRRRFESYSVEQDSSNYAFDVFDLDQESPPQCATVLSKNPLVYVIPDLLTESECQCFKDRVLQLESEQNRKMTRSNPPQVSLDKTKLWPLPILAMGFGLPPLVGSVEEGNTITLNLILSKFLPPVLIALFGSALLALAVVSAIRLFSDSSSRTSDAVAFNELEDIPFVRELVTRVENTTHHPWHAWEAPVVTRYRKGAIFARHGDASPTKGSEWNDVGGQRVITAICYLNTLEHGSGGETYFDKLNISVTPNRGSALFFFPANATTLDANDLTTHESKSPSEEKWIVQMFGRVGPRVPPPLGLPDEYGVTTSP